jgi:hypothetical protein
MAGKPMKKPDSAMSTLRLDTQLTLLSFKFGLSMTVDFYQRVSKAS